MSDALENRKVYVIYVPNKGFMKNKKGQFIKTFADARIFGNEKGALRAQEVSRALKGVDSYIIDVDMVLDPRKIFKKILIGKD